MNDGPFLVPHRIRGGWWDSDFVWRGGNEVTQTSSERWFFRAVQPFSSPLDNVYVTRQKQRVRISFCVLLMLIAVAMVFMPDASPFAVALLSIASGAVMYYFMVVSTTRELKKCGVIVEENAFAVRSIDRFDWFPLAADSVLVIEAGSPAGRHWKVYAEDNPERFVRVRREEHPDLVSQLQEKSLQWWGSEGGSRS